MSSARSAGSYALLFQSYRPFGLSQTLRIYIFIGLFAVGTLISFLGALLLLTNPFVFLFLFSIGLTLTLSSTCFLFHPVKQMKMSMDKVRAPATITFIVGVTIVIFVPLCLYFIVGRTDAFMVIFSVIGLTVIYGSLLWYALSFIPFARDVIVGAGK